MRAKLTTKLVNSLTPQAKMYKVWDTEIQGYFLRVLPSGTATFCLHYRHNGKARDFTLGKLGKYTAETARDAAKVKVADLTQEIDIQERKKMNRAEEERQRFDTLGAFIEHKYSPWVLTQRKRGDETLTLLENNFEYLYPRRMAEIVAWDMQKWRNERLKEKYKPATVNRRITTLKSVLSKAVEWGILTSNPLVNVKPLKLDNKGAVRYLTDDEERRLRAALDTRQEDIITGRTSANEWRRVRGYELKENLEGATFADYLKPMVILAMNTGLRRGELFQLLWCDVDLKKRILTVEGSGAKSGKTRHIPLNDEALGLLIAWKNQGKNTELVFPSPISGEQIDNIKRSWTRLRKLSGLSDFRFHDLRHDFASKLVMAGVDLNTVRELLGHSTLEMTLRYAHLAPEHKAAAVALLNRV